MVQQLSVHQHNLVVTPPRSSDIERHDRPNINIVGNENKATFIGIIENGLQRIPEVPAALVKTVAKGLGWGWNKLKELFKSKK